MNWKMLAVGIIIVAVFAGTFYAITGATPTISGTQSRWAGASAGSITTEGGNISAVNIASISLTDRWTAFYGNVTGNIVLGTNTQNIFNWTFASSAGGDICVSTNSSMLFASPITAVESTVNSVFTLGATADNATNTFSGTCAQINLTSGNIASPIKITHKGLSTFTTCAITADSGTGKGNHAFCTYISSTGKDYLNDTVHYEVMAPTTPGASAETYYFYAELS